jgi:hypothetical protein
MAQHSLALLHLLRVQLSYLRIDIRSGGRAAVAERPRSLVGSKSTIDRLLGMFFLMWHVCWT